MAAIASAPDAGVAPAPPVPRPPVKRRSNLTDQIMKSAANESKARAKLAARWLMIMAIIFTITGVIVGFQVGNDAAEARKALAGRDPGEVFGISRTGQPVTVGQVLAEVDTQVRRVCVIYFVLASGFLALSFWGRRSPLPAAITGLSLYLVIQVMNAWVDPATLFQGFILKTVFIAVMVKAITSAASENAWRRAARPAAPPAPAAIG